MRIIQVQQDQQDKKSLLVPCVVNGMVGKRGLLMTNEKSLLRVLSDEGLICSLAEGRRLIAQNAIKVDGLLVHDPSTVLQLSQLPVSVKVGKRTELVIQDINKT